MQNPGVLDSALVGRVRQRSHGAARGGMRCYKYVCLHIYSLSRCKGPGSSPSEFLGVHMFDFSPFALIIDAITGLLGAVDLGSLVSLLG